MSELVEPNGVFGSCKGLPLIAHHHNFTAKILKFLRPSQQHQLCRISLLLDKIKEPAFIVELHRIAGHTQGPFINLTSVLQGLEHDGWNSLHHELSKLGKEWNMSLSQIY